MTSKELEEFDRDLASGRIDWTRDLALAYASAVKSHPVWDTMCGIKQFSMLGVETLMMCRGYGLAAKSGVIEIGAYVGGSTVAMGMGLDQAGRKPMVTVDVGGANSDQPFIPSDDIHADWHKNVTASGLEGISTLVGGWSYDEPTIRAVKRAACGAKFDVFLLDGNGMVKRSLNNYADQMTDDCLLILDDYYNVHGSQEKVEIVAREVHELMDAGVIEQYVLTPFSTWFGRLAKRETLS